MNTDKTGYKILLFEDNPIDAALIKRALTKNDNFMSIQSIAHAKNLSEGIALLEGEPEDLILLDLNLPDAKGIPLLRQVRDKAPFIPVVAITAESDPAIAIDVLEAGALDYVVKDEINGNLLSRTLRFAIERSKKLKEPLQLSEQVKENIRQSGAYFNSNLFIKTGNKYVSILFSDILFVEATGDYVVIQSTSGKYITHCTMNEVESKFNPEKFVRVHRSYIVNFGKINNIQENVLSIGDEVIPIGRTYKQVLMDKINML